ncbi:C40 family peptidase [Actinomadura sp. LCR2-06]|uniref:C40 family peptidase n=2 Tax=Actinomadura violacea TaxID=2819934 RepID=A0ABS3S074_9ACTN|nr:C40 family peptidase [Actinomadura violacea]
MSKLHSAFSTGVASLGAAWEKLKAVTKKPVNFMIGTVYNHGIVSLWNKIIDWLHIPGMRLGQMGLLASGGTIDNPANAVPMQVNRPMAIVGEGRPQYPEYVIPTDPRYRGRAKALWSAAGSKLQMLAGGGVIGGFFGKVKQIAGKVVDVGKAGLDLLAHPGEIWDKLAKPVLSMAKGIGGSPYAQAIAAIPKKILDTAKGAALSVTKAFNEGFSGGGSSNAVEAARKYIGVPYVWGGTSHSGIDCSGLTMRAWLDGAHKNITRTTYSQKAYLKRIPGPRPGSPGQPHPGHTYLASRVQGGRVWVVEAAHTGTNVSEHLLTRPTPWWGWPPGMAAGGILKRLGERYVKNGDAGSQLARYLGVAGDPGGIAVGYPGPGPGAPALKRDSGGPLPPGSWAFNGLSGTEWVLTPEAVDYLGGDRAVAAINAVAARRAHSPAEPARPALGGGPTAQVIVNPQPKQSETEIGMVAARKIGVMLS